jgi:hypothetical protein
MELDEFVTTTLKSLIKAVNDTKEYSEANGAIINPIFMEREFDSKQETSIWRKDGQDGRRSLTKVEFDVAVSATNEAGNNVGGGLKIHIVNFGASSTNKESSQTSSRIKFSINIALPHQGDR